MIAPIAGTEMIDPAYIADRGSSSRRVNQFFQDFRQFTADVFILAAGINDALRFPTSEVDSDATLQISGKGERP
ncbi:MAG: hypothetical protein ACM3SP_14600, partial [Chloroflexota bacterium]